MFQRLPYVLIFLIAAAASLTGGLDRFDHMLMDMRFRLDRHAATDRIVLVEINESSLQRLSTWPWPRRTHAQLLTRLVAAGAEEIVLDIDFSSRSNPHDDQLLATALAAAGSRVILPAFKQIELTGDGSPRMIETLPAEEFRRNARLATFNVRPEPDGVVRRLQFNDTLAGQDVPAIASMLAREKPRASRYYVDFGIDLKTIPRIGYADVLEGRFDPTAVKDKIVLVGATAVQLGDMVTVPIYRSIPGITLQALAYQSLVGKRAFEVLGAVPLLAVALLLAMIGGPLLRRISWRRGLAAVVAGSIAVVAGSFALQSAAAIYPPPALWMLTLVLAYIVALFGKIEQQDVILLIQRLAMRRRAAFMKMVVENSFDAIFTVATDMRIRTANKAAEAMFGYSAAELVGKDIGALLSAGSPSGEARAQVVRTLATPGTYQLSAANRAGAAVYLDVAASQMKLDDEILLIVTARDVTARTLAERVARKALDQLRDAVETIPEGFALFGADDRLVLCNEKYREINSTRAFAIETGSGYAEIQSALARSAFYPDASGSEEAWLSARLKAHASAAEPFVDVIAGGRWLLTNEHKTADGGTIVVQTDITGLKQREKEMAALVNKFAQVAAGVAATTTGIVITDPGAEGGPIVFVNPAFTEMTGYTERESLGRSFDFLSGAETDPGRLQEINEAIANHRSSRTVIRSYRKDRSEFWNEINLSPVRDERGHVSYYVWILTDVTERIRSERALVEAKTTAEVSNRSKTEFLHNMSHELRTPLNAIIGFSEVMLMETFGPLGNPRYSEYAGGIHQSGQHLLSVINDVLDISKIEAGRFELSEQEISLARVVESVVQLVRDRAERAKVAFGVRGIDDLPLVKADERVMKQILINLLDNAIKFTPEGGKVALGAGYERASGLWIVVADTGIGIPSEHLTKVMEPFGQVDSSLNRKYNGTGLGLPLAKRFIEMHGGTLTLESRVDVGTKVTLRLPSDRLIVQPQVRRISTRKLAP